MEFICISHTAMVHVSHSRMYWGMSVSFAAARSFAVGLRYLLYIIHMHAWIHISTTKEEIQNDEPKYYDYSLSQGSSVCVLSTASR